MKKAEFLRHWAGLEANAAIPVSPIEYKHEGSTYGEDSIRITGTTAFVDGVLGRLKDMLRHEANTTRLQVVYKDAADKDGNIIKGSVVCYIQVHTRGPEAQILNTRYNLVGESDGVPTRP